MKRKPTKLNVMSIVHGKSELLMCSSVKSNLKIKHEIHAKDRGRHSIQVNSVLQELNSTKFNMSLKDFSEKYDISYDSKNKRLVNFKLFIIMDLDDCTQEKAEQFKNKSMFNGHMLYEYIVPIYNDPNLEKTIHDLVEIIYVFLTIFLYLPKCPQSLILSALRAFCFCGKPRISRSIFLYFPCQSWLKSW